MQDTASPFMRVALDSAEPQNFMSRDLAVAGLDLRGPRVGADTLTLIRRQFQAASAATYETRFECSGVDPSRDGGAPDHRLGLRMTARW